MSRISFVFASFLMLACTRSAHADSENKLFYDAVRAEAAEDFDSAIRFYEQSAKKSHSILTMRTALCLMLATNVCVDRTDRIGSS